MPRALINVPDEEQEIKKSRAPRKPRVVSGHDISVSKQHKQIVPKDGERVDENLESVRKAPTTIAYTKKRHRRSNKSFVIVLVFCILLTGSGIGVGMTDKGEINVVAVVDDRNEKINRGEVRDAQTGEVTSQTVPVQSDDPRPNGGLRAAEAPTEQTTPSAPQTTSASSTSQANTTATSSISGSTTKETSVIN